MTILLIWLGNLWWFSYIKMKKLNYFGDVTWTWPWSDLWPSSWAEMLQDLVHSQHLDLHGNFQQKNYQLYLKNLKSAVFRYLALIWPCDDLSPLSSCIRLNAQHHVLPESATKGEIFDWIIDFSWKNLKKYGILILWPCYDLVMTFDLWLNVEFSALSKSEVKNGASYSKKLT